MVRATIASDGHFLGNPYKATITTGAAGRAFVSTQNLSGEVGLSDQRTAKGDHIRMTIAEDTFHDGRCSKTTNENNGDLKATPDLLNVFQKIGLRELKLLAEGPDDQLEPDSFPSLIILQYLVFRNISPSDIQSGFVSAAGKLDRVYT